MGRGSSKIGGGREVSDLQQSAEKVSSILDEYARLTNGRKIDGDTVTLADGTKMTKDEYDEAVRELNKEYLNEAAKQRKIGEELGIDTTTGQVKNTSSRAESSTEQNIYDMKGATQKKVKSALDAAPEGTTIAMAYSEDSTKIVYEKIGTDVFGDGIWMETKLHPDGGVSTGYNRSGNIVRNVQDMTKDKSIIRGLSERDRRIYNTTGKELIKDYVKGRLGDKNR